MPSRWQREYRCDWCGGLSQRLGGEIRTPGLLGWGLQYRLCLPCVERLRDLMVTDRYADIAAWRVDHGWPIP